MSPYRTKAARERVPRLLSPQRRFNRLWLRLARRRFAHIPSGIWRTLVVYTEGVALVVWLWWRCLRMRRVMRVHASLRPYTIELHGGGTRARFPELRRWRDNVKGRAA